MVRGIGGHYKKGVSPFRTRKRAASFVARAYTADLSKAQARRIFVAQGGRQYYFEQLWRKNNRDARQKGFRKQNREAQRFYGERFTPFGAKEYQRLVRLGYSSRYSSSFRALEEVREFYPEAGMKNVNETEMVVH